jgi:predicted DNA-binding transcriptional regulator AlpA
MASSLMEQRWFTPRALADKLGVSVRTLGDWRRKGRGPLYLQVGYRNVKYPAEDVERWLQSLWGRTNGGRYREGLAFPGQVACKRHRIKSEQRGAQDIAPERKG